MWMQYLYRITLIGLCSFIISSLLYKPLHQTKKNKTLISAYYYTKERGVRASEQHRCHSESHILLPACRLHSCCRLAHKSWVTSVPLRNEMFSPVSVMQKDKKKKIEYNRKNMEWRVSQKCFWPQHTIWITAFFLTASLFQWQCDMLCKEDDITLEEIILR